MSRLGALAWAVAVAFGLTATLAVQARPYTPAEKREIPYSGALPSCQDPAVLTTIRNRFSQRERTYWRTGQEIESFARVREIGYRSNGPEFIPRRYCMARVSMANGRQRPVSYTIGEGLGMIGWGWGVEWCVHGLDYGLAFAPDCRMARP